MIQRCDARGCMSYQLIKMQRNIQAESSLCRKSNEMICIWCPEREISGKLKIFQYHIVPPAFAARPLGRRRGSEAQESAVCRALSSCLKCHRISVACDHLVFVAATEGNFLSSSNISPRIFHCVSGLPFILLCSIRTMLFVLDPFPFVLCIVLLLLFVEALVSPGRIPGCQPNLEKYAEALNKVYVFLRLWCAWLR